VGKRADFCVLDIDIVAEPERIGQARVVLTMMNGEVVFDTLGLAIDPIGEIPDTTATTSDALRRMAWTNVWLALV